jgi:hypothetical protein
MKQEWRAKFNSPYPKFVKVRSEGNCKCSVLIYGTQFALTAFHKTSTTIIIIIIIIIYVNLKVGNGIRHK